MQRTLFPRLLAGALLIVGGTAACSEDTSTVVRPLPNRAFNFVLTREGTNVPRGSVVQTRTNAVVTATVMDIQGLELLRDPYHYQVWMATHTTATNLLSDFRPLTATRLIRTTTDTSISEIGDFVPRVVIDTTLNFAGSFNSGGPGTRLVFEFNANALDYFNGARPTGTTRILLVTIDSNPAAPRVPDEVGSQGRLWARAISTAPAAPVAPATVTTRTTALSFGNFHADAAQQYVY